MDNGTDINDLAEKHMQGCRQLSANQRQRNRDEAKKRIEIKSGTPSAQKVLRPKWQAAASEQANTGQKVSLEFARVMLETFRKGEKFMAQEHVENRYTLLDECIRTGYMSPELQKVYDWTVKACPDINPHFKS